MDRDISSQLQEQVCEALNGRTPLAVVGAGSKAFLGRHARGLPLTVAGHRGIVAYEPTELVITARAGTPLAEIQALLADKGQMLPFEPPDFGAGGTFGGMIAAGLAGPRRPFAGALRDAVLGLRCLDGQGRLLSFGGQVVKNVAGFDLSRLLTGSMGTLAVILEASVSVIPRPETERTLKCACSRTEALQQMRELAGQPLPLSAMCWHQGELMIRFSGRREAVDDACRGLLAEVVADGEATTFWNDLRDHRLPFFASPEPLWRLSLPFSAAATDIGEEIIDWGGAQRWLRTSSGVDEVRDRVRRQGGTANCFYGGDRDAEIYHPPSKPVMALQQRIRSVLDPQGLFDGGRLYAQLAGVG